MKKLLIAALLLLPLWLLAQEKDSTNTLVTGSYASTTVAFSNRLSALNRQLRTAGQLPLSEALIGVSLGVTNRFADQNSYQSTRLSLLTTRDESSNSNQDTHLILGELSFFGNFDVVASPRWLVYPYIGAGVNYARLTVSSVVSNANFQTSLANPGIQEVDQKRYGTDGLMLFGELGLGVERSIKLSDGVVFVGLSGGYRLSTSNSWVLKGVKFYDASFNTQGWVIELKLRAEEHSDSNGRNRGLFKFFK